MKLKNIKNITIITVLLAVILVLNGCQKEPVLVEEKIGASIEFLDENYGLLPYKNGDTDVDPKELKFITITFDKPMNKNYTVYIYYNPDFMYDVIEYIGWINSYTLVYEFDLNYDTEYHFEINDEDYRDDSYDKEKSYLRGLNGKFAENIVINFSTKKYTRIEPKTFEFNIENYSFKLADNNENKANTQQVMISGLKSFLNHELLIKGDTVKINYNISSVYDLHKLRMNIVDVSLTANYWLVLNDPVDLVLAENLSASTDGNTNYKSGTLVFTINEPMLRSVSLQVWDDYNETNPELVSIDFNKIN